MQSPKIIDSQDELQSLFEQQKAAYLSNPFPEYESRIAQLKLLRDEIKQNQDVIASAISQDFGCRNENESKLIDVLGCVFDLNHTLKHLKGWMKPVKRSTELLFKGNSVEVRYQPKGVIGIIVPWNFPVYLAVAPLTAAIAAGNRVMIKMSESTPQTTEALANLLSKVFKQDQVAVVGGEVELAQYFTSIPFDHILYTGSTHVGRLVMQAAAKNLTPVTLELGGKSPAVISNECDLKKAAQKIAHGKMTNAGQVCIAPDYVFVPEEKVNAFQTHIRNAYESLYKDESTPTTVVNQHHYDRLQGLISDAKEKGASVESLLTPAAAKERFQPLTMVTAVNDDMKIMQEEIFGSLLPILPYKADKEVVDYINARPRPLALYYFGDNDRADTLMRQTHSGGVSVNDWGWHAFNNDVPFGGVGASGMGRYHGHEGFLELSHAKSVFRERTWFPVELFHPPYNNLHKTIFRVFLGKPNTRS